MRRPSKKFWIILTICCSITALLCGIIIGYIYAKQGYIFTASAIRLFPSKFDIWSLLIGSATVFIAAVAIWQSRKANDMNNRLLCLEEKRSKAYVFIKGIGFGSGNTKTISGAIAAYDSENNKSLSFHLINPSESDISRVVLKELIIMTGTNQIYKNSTRLDFQNSVMLSGAEQYFYVFGNINLDSNTDYCINLRLEVKNMQLVNKQQSFMISVIFHNDEHGNSGLIGSINDIYENEGALTYD